jgi:hypothetical protein
MKVIPDWAYLMKVILSVPDEGYSRLSVPDEGYFERTWWRLFQSERTWWRLFQKPVVRTRFDIYVFIIVCLRTKFMSKRQDRVLNSPNNVSVINWWNIQANLKYILFFCVFIISKHVYFNVIGHYLVNCIVMHVVILCCFYVMYIFMLCIYFYIRSKALQSLCCIFDFMPNQNKFFLSYLILSYGNFALKC